MKKIESLTKEQSDKVPVYLKKWLDNGRSTERLDRNKAETAIKTIYRCAKFDEPKYFFHFPSPLQCQLAVSFLKHSDLEIKKLLNDGDNLGANLGANLGDNLVANLWANLVANLGDNLRANLVANLWANLGDNLKTEFHNMFYGNIDWESGWSGFYDFILNELFEERISEFKSFIDYLEAIKNVHVFIPYKDIVFVSDRPEGLSVNDKGRLHADLKPAMHYSDGYSLFYLNGVRVPKEIVLIDGSKLKTLEVIGQKNVDVRREGLRKIPIERIIEDTKARVLDTWKNPRKAWCDYVLYDMSFGDGKIRRVLKMKNPSVPDTVHFERVADDINTCQDALAWRAGLKVYAEPVVLT